MRRSRSKTEWRENTLAPALTRGKQRRERFETSSGLEIEPVYTTKDLNGIDYHD